MQKFRPANGEVGTVMIIGGGTFSTKIADVFRPHNLNLITINTENTCPLCEAGIPKITLTIPEPESVEDTTPRNRKERRQGIQKQKKCWEEPSWKSKK